MMQKCALFSHCVNGNPFLRKEKERKGKKKKTLSFSEISGNLFDLGEKKSFLYHGALLFFSLDDTFKVDLWWFSSELVIV